MQPRLDVPIGPLTSLGVGGPARYFWKVTQEDELLEALRWARRRGVSVKVLGGGSNIVVADRGFEGLVIQVAIRGITYGGQDQAKVQAAAGEPWHAFVLEQVRNHRQGIECLAGIPGFLGATPIQNVGAYGQEVCETIERVVALDIETLRFREFDNAALGFGYRDSFFKREAPDSFVVTRVCFRLRPGAPAALRYGELDRAAAELRERLEVEQLTLTQIAELVLELRSAKSMVLVPWDENGRSCGSFFVNPRLSRQEFDALAARCPNAEPPRYAEPDGRVKVPAAWLIEQAGLTKGMRSGPVGLSTKHTLALVCHDGATAGDVVRFAHEIRHTVEARFGVRLTSEPVFWGFGEPQDGLPSP